MKPDWANVSRETQLLLEQYSALLLKWNKKINLIGDENNLWQRHIWDSYQLIDLIPSGAQSLIDVGSGAGLPGIVMAMATPLQVTLVERDERKAAFLREAVRVLALSNVTVVAKDICEVSGVWDVISARALTSLDELLALSAARMGTNSICLFPKGERFATEVEKAREHWDFDSHITPSRTDKNSAIISITKLKNNEKVSA